MPPEVFKFTDDGARLVVLTDLDQHFADDFERACRRLVKAQAAEITIDLSRVNYMNSTCLGELLLTSDRCREFDKRLQLRISRQLSSLFDLVSIGDFIEIEVAD